MRHLKDTTESRGVSIHISPNCYFATLASRNEKTFGEACFAKISPKRVYLIGSDLLDAKRDLELHI